MTDLLGHPIVDPFKQSGFPGFRRHVGGGDARLCRGDAGERRAGDVRLHLGRARLPRRRRATSTSPSARLDQGYVEQLDGIRRGIRSVLQAARRQRDHQADNTLFVVTVGRRRPFRRRAEERLRRGEHVPCDLRRRTRSARSTPTSTRWSRTSFRRSPHVPGKRGAERVHGARRRRPDLLSGEKGRGRRRARPDRSPDARVRAQHRESDRGQPMA